MKKKIILKEADFKFIIRNAIHYNSSCIIAKNYKDIIKICEFHGKNLDIRKIIVNFRM